MHRERLMRFGCALAMLYVGACMREPKSSIVEKLQAAGASDLSTASSDAIQQWLGKRKDLAIEIENMCKSVRPAATANWTDTTEGRICSASAQLTFYRYTPQKGDGKTYKSGWQ